MNETEIERRARETYLRRKTEQVLANEEMTRRVVVAAVQAQQVLIGPDKTVDGDKASMVARNMLTTALTDYDALRKVLKEW